MRYRPGMKEEARELRKRGYSLTEIHLKMSVPVTTVSSWVSDITLTQGQLARLKNRTQNSLQKGRERAQILRQHEKEIRAKELFKKGRTEVSLLNERDLFIAGVALYWAEGFKNRHH